MGIFWIVTGTIAIIASFGATLATVLVFGVLLLFAGVVQLAHAFINRSADWGWHLIAGSLYALVGLLLVVDPVNGAIGLTFLIGLLFVVSAGLRFARAWAARHAGRSLGWHLAGGVLNLVLAALILSGWPQTGTWVIGLFVGIELVLAGLTLIFVPAAARQGSLL